MKKKVKHIWRLIAKSIGEKSGTDDKEADIVATIRLIITIQILLTNFLIIFGVLRTHIFPKSDIIKVVCVRNK
jgi:hypothetical protein